LPPLLAKKGFVLLRVLLALFLAISVAAGPAFAGTMHTASGGCAAGEGSHQHAPHMGVGHGHEPAPKSVPVVAPCCLAGCLVLAAAEMPAMSLPRQASPAMRPETVLLGHMHEPADPPPRPDFLRT
jgi:hypothetical protein